MGRNAESIATKRSHSLEISTPGAAQGARDQASERDLPSMPTPFPRLPAPLRTRPPVVSASRAPPAARVRWRPRAADKSSAAAAAGGAPSVHVKKKTKSNPSRAQRRRPARTHAGDDGFPRRAPRRPAARRASALLARGNASESLYCPVGRQPDADCRKQQGNNILGVCIWV